MKKKRRKFTDEFKDEAVKLVLEQKATEFLKQRGTWAFMLICLDVGNESMKMVVSVDLIRGVQ